MIQKLKLVILFAIVAFVHWILFVSLGTFENDVMWIFDFFTPLGRHNENKTKLL